MRTEDFLRQVTALPGLSGNEGEVARFIAEAFRPYCDEVTIDPLNSVIGHIRGNGPKVMLCAHLDEIGLMVSDIEKTVRCACAALAAWIRASCPACA
ncbi:MAG: hypothetical protein V8Q82_09560 [Christensenellales bacterium]